jgi:AhpC/TSA antioxidant enzyme
MPCQAHLGEVQSLKNEFDRRGVAIVVVSFSEPAMLIHYQEQHRWPFTVLADPQRTAYRAFTLPRLSWFRVFSPATLKLYWNLRRRGMKQDAYGGDDIYQAGGDFILDREGTILVAHRSQDPADRPAAAKLLAEIDRISAGSAP